MRRDFFSQNELQVPAGEQSIVMWFEQSPSLVARPPRGPCRRVPVGVVIGSSGGNC